MTSFSVVSLIAIVPDSECSTPTLMASAAPARPISPASTMLLARPRASNVFFIVELPPPIEPHRHTGWRYARTGPNSLHAAHRT
jgi:hypothetical protein